MRFALAAALALLALTACGDQVQKAKPPEKPSAGMPPGHPPAGMPPGHPPVQQPAGHGTASRPAAADPFVDAADAGKTAMASATPSDPERVVLAGEIAIDPAVPLGESSTVYVIAVYAPQDRAPVLVKRFEKPKFPLAFELREKDSQMGPRQADRPLYLRAMISDSGDVMKNRNRTTSETALQPFTKDAKLTIK